MSALDFKARVDPLHAFSLAVIVRFTSGVTPADCIGVSMVAEPFRSTYLQMRPYRTQQAQRCKPFGHSGLARNISSLHALESTVLYVIGC